MPRNTERETIARAIIVQDGRILVNSAINKQTEEAYCALPGGHADVMESCVATLEREFHEELAADVSVGELQFVSESIYEGRRRGDTPRHELVLYFGAELTSPLGQEDGRIMSPEFDKNFIWLALDKLEESNLLPVALREFLTNTLAADGTIAATSARYGFHDSTSY